MPRKYAIIGTPVRPIPKRRRRMLAEALYLALWSPRLDRSPRSGHEKGPVLYRLFVGDRPGPVRSPNSEGPRRSASGPSHLRGPSSLSRVDRQRPASVALGQPHSDALIVERQVVDHQVDECGFRRTSRSGDSGDSRLVVGFDASPRDHGLSDPTARAPHHADYVRSRGPRARRPWGT